VVIRIACEGSIATSKVVAIMSMSLDGYVADRNDGVAEVFDWYFTSGDVEIHTGGSNRMTFKVSEPSAEYLRGLASGLGAVLTGRRTFEVAQGWAEITRGTSVRPYPSHPRRMSATQLDGPLGDR
jgi:dihydrofolate reductase